MIKLPPNGLWAQPNTSDRVGAVWASKNVNFDETNYIKLSPRAVKLLDEATNSDFGLPVSVGRFQQGQFQVATTSDANFVTTLNTTALTVTEESGTAEPTLTIDSHGVFFHNYWLASTTNQVFRKAANGSASATWTSAAMSLTSAVNHALEVFDSRNQLCVANGNLVEEYTESGGTFTDVNTLTIPSDFEIVGLKYNNGQMGIITQSGQGSTGQLLEAKFYVWDGVSTSATGWGIGAEKALAIASYQSSWLILTNKGELKLFNGGGFTLLAQFPFSAENKWLESIVQTGDCMCVDGERVFINIGTSLTAFGVEGEQYLPNFPSGVYCYDPKVGLYHRYAASNSQAYVLTISASGADTTTNIITASGTIPATGNPIRLVSGTLTGITKNKPYFLTKHSATTFSLAESKESALAGIKIDLTATNSDTIYFHTYDIVDYGVTWRNDMSAVALFGETSNVYTDVLFGGDCRSIAALANNDVLCMTVPDVESRGWIISPKVFSQQASDTTHNLWVKYRPLKTGDSIIVKVKDRDVPTLPTSAPANATTGVDELTWTGTNAGYTGIDLSEAKTYFDAGGELECEFTAGAGAGQCVKVSNLTESDGTYTLEFAEDVVGAASSRLSYFIIDAWKQIGVIDTNLTKDGYCIQSIPVGSKEKFVQFKVELRGSGVSLEELPWAQSVDKPVV